MCCSHSQVAKDTVDHTSSPSAALSPCPLETPPTPAEMDARLAQYEQRTEEEEDEDEEDEERIPDLQKDDMMARRTGVFHKQNTAAVTYNRFLPLPASQRCNQGELTTDAAPRNKREVQEERSKQLNYRVERKLPRIPMETPKPHPESIVTRATSYREQEYDDEDDYDENEPLPDLEKDDMMARRTGLSQKTSAARANQFLPVPGSVKYNIAPVSAMKPFHHRRPKHTERMTSESSTISVAADSEAPSSKASTLPKPAGLRKKPEEERKQEGTVTEVAGPLCALKHTSPPTAATAAINCKVEAKMDQQNAEEKMEERKKDMKEEPRKKPSWLEDDDLPPMM